MAKIPTKEELMEEHWQDMPEFVQEKQEPYAKINFRFETKEDLEEFCELIGQKLTNKTKSAWFPFKERGANTRDKYWISDL
jgi:putative SOS response-associated peptidase YedK